MTDVPFDESHFRTKWYTDLAVRNYSNILQAINPYKHLTWNDLTWYRGQPAVPPPSPFVGGYFLRDNNRLLVHYQAITHLPIGTAREVVIFPPGSWAWPEDHWDGDRGIYMNMAGRDLFQLGYDIVSNAITNYSAHIAMRHRLARQSHLVHDAYTLDAMRTKALIEHVAPNYDRIHLCGVSTGGMLIMMAYEMLLAEQSSILSKIGLVMPFAGWYWADFYLQDLNTVVWTAINWEIVFPGPTQERFMTMTNQPGVVLAYGTGENHIWVPMYANVPADRKKSFVGGHEFDLATFTSALSALSALP